jgi:hypothetical protein
MKDQILKMAGVKSEKEFYKKFPTEESFKAKYGKQLKKAEMGSKMVNTQLHQLTDFGNPPIAQNGINFNDLMTNASAKNAGMSRQQYDTAQQQHLDAQNAAASKSGGSGGIGDLIGTAVKYAPQIMEAIGKNGKKIKKAQDGSWASAGVPGLSTATYDKSTGLVDNASGSVSQADTTALGFADKAPGAGGFDFKGAAMAGIGVAPQIIAGAQKIKQQKTDIQKAHTAADVSGLTAQAASLRPELVKNKYVRPEDTIAQPGQLGNPQGKGTNFLSAANGTQIQNTYAPTGTLYNDLGYEPLNDSNPKQYAFGGPIPTAEFGDYFQDSGQAEIGGAAGQAIGTYFGGPIGGMIGKTLGNVAGNLLGGAADMNKLHGYQDTTKRNTQQAAFASGANALHAQNAAYMKDGGYMDSEHEWVSNGWQPQVIAHFGDMDVSQVHSFAHQGMDSLRAGGHLKEYTPPSERAMSTERPDMAFGGELQSHWGGGLETISHNQYDASPIIMPKGQSHDESDGKGRTGIGITYGKNPVEVERNEPMVKMEDGGNQDSLVVFGNMIEDESGKKYKILAKDIAKSNNKQNNLKDKATSRINATQEYTPFDQFKMNSSMATLTGADMKLQQNSMKLKDLAAKQNAILDTAEEHGLDADALAKGKIKQAKKGAKISKAQKGGDYDIFNPQQDIEYTYAPTAPEYIDETGGDLANSPIGRTLPNFDTPGFGTKAWQAIKLLGSKTSDIAGKGFNKYGPAVLSNVSPFLKPTNQRPLDPEQIYPEMMAMALNQVQPVKAQGFEPILQDQPSRISLQDQLNTINAQGRAALQQLGNDPSAVATVMANLADAKNRVLGEQFRANQQAADQTYAANRAAINQAKLQNLQIYDTQAGRQSEAASKTKQQAIEIAKSLAAKKLQSDFANRDLAIKENLYNYRFSPSGVAYNVNDPYQFNMSGSPFARTNNKGQLAPGKKYIYDESGNIVDVQKDTAKHGAKIKARNGSIVKAMKSL